MLRASREAFDTASALLPTEPFEESLIHRYTKRFFDRGLLNPVEFFLDALRHVKNAIVSVKIE